MRFSRFSSVANTFLPIIQSQVLTDDYFLVCGAKMAGARDFCVFTPRWNNSIDRADFFAIIPPVHVF
jgi:hypothetical protein